MSIVSHRPGRARTDASVRDGLAACAVRCRAAACAMMSLLLAASAPARAQPAAPPSNSLPPLLSQDREIDLARSAAPPAISDSAAVYVLRRGGHVRVRDGTNGYTCIVNRDHPLSLYPECYDPEGSRTVLGIELFAQRLREHGVPEADVQRRVKEGLASGVLSRPRHLAIAYMMSRSQNIYASASGPHVGVWHPHIMIYIAGALSPDDLRIPSSMGRLVSISTEWTLPQLTVITGVWSDGVPETVVALHPSS